MTPPAQLRNGRGWIIGFKRRMGGRIKGRGASGLIVGWYDWHTDETRAHTGWIVGRSDMLDHLLYGQR